MSDPRFLRRDALTCLVLAVVTVAIYWRLGSAPFVAYDDNLYVTENPQVQSGLTLAGIRRALTAECAGNWHPLTLLSHMLDCQLFGLDAGKHHLVNLAFHLANTLLLFWLLRYLTGAFWPCALTAALFAWHPLHVQSVAWIAERKDVLSGFFGLLALLAYARYAKSPHTYKTPDASPPLRGGEAEETHGGHSPDAPRLSRPATKEWGESRSEGLLISNTRTRKVGEISASSPQPSPPLRGREGEETHGGHSPDAPRLSSKNISPTSNSKAYYFLALVFFALGLLSKPMLVTLPCLMLLLDFWPLNRPYKSFPKLILEKIPFFILSLISCVVTYRVQSTEGATKALHIALADRLANALISYCRYLGKFAWPTHLAVLYPYEHSFGAVKVIGAIGLLIAVTVIAFYSRRRRPYILMGWLWFLGSLVPVIGLIQVGKQSMADRYTYLPSIGIFVALAWWLADLELKFPGKKRIVEFACALALTGCAIQSWRQLAYWQSSELLFRHALDVTTDNEVMEYNLGVLLSHEGRYDEALAHAVRALSLDASDAAVYNAIGGCLTSLDRHAEALEYYVKAEQLKPDDFATRFNHGQSLEKLGDTAGALQQYSAAVRAQPGNFTGHLALGALLVNLGRVAEAQSELAEAVKLQPGAEAAHAELASALNALGKTGEAIAEFQLALKLNPSDYVALNNLAWIRAANARSEFRSGAEAVQLAQRACEVTKFGQPELIGTLAAAYAEAGDFPHAIATTKKAIELALATGQKDLAATNQTLLGLYQSGQPFHETPTPK